MMRLVADWTVVLMATMDLFAGISNQFTRTLYPEIAPFCKFDSGGDHFKWTVVEFMMNISIFVGGPSGTESN